MSIKPISIAFHKACLWDSEKVVDTAAIDRYSFIRVAYLQRRRSLVYDGNPPPDPEEDELLHMNDKPRSESRDVPFASVPMDQYGGVVAGSSPSFEQQAGKAAQPPAAGDDAAAKRTGSAAAPAPPTPAAREDAVGAPPAADKLSSPGSSTYVRVWLPGNAAQ